jgi:tRNA pseudouridine38-40 synthase
VKNIKLVLEYDGTKYAGWQRQNNAITIQQMLEESIYHITGEELKVIGSSRTDAGVHARGFVANFKTDSSIPEVKFSAALNSKLPEDIVVLQSSLAPDDFHARYSSSGKTYSYTVLNRVQPAAIDRNYVYHYRGELDIKAIRDACSYFIGKHDFAAFKNAGSSVKSTERTISEVEVIKNGDYLKFYITGDGFLYNMVRIMVGTLIEVGIGKIKPWHIEHILLSKDRTNAGKSAPASGLCLEKVYYNT